MPRLKFLLFAVIAIGLGLAHVPFVTRPYGASLLDQAQVIASGAPALVAARISDRRVELLQHGTAATGTAPVVAASRGTKTDLTQAQRVVELRAALANALTPELRASLVLGFLSDTASVYVRGDAEPVTDGSGLEMTALSGAPAEGVVVDAFDQPHLFYVLPISRLAESGEAKAQGSFFLGAPVLSQAVVDELRQQAGVSSLTVYDRGTAKWKSGDPNALKLDVKPGFKGVLFRGGIPTFGLLELPMFVDEGAGAPQFVGSRQVVPSSRFEVTGVVSVRQAMASLANYQQMVLIAVAGMFLLAVIITLLLKKEDTGPGMVLGDRDLRPTMGPAFASTLATTKQTPLEDDSDNEQTLAGDLNTLLKQEAPEASPDDFDFPTSSPPRREPDGGYDGTASNGVAQYEQAEAMDAAEPPAGAMSAPGFSALNSDDSPTAAYPAYSPTPLPPEAMPDDSESESESDFNAEQTRIAEIPDELIRQTARRTADDIPASVAPEDKHFQDVYREFMNMREECGETGEGMSFDKFAAKLRKNREQLVQKYNCRTVRFQVYVKEGKAALKATPVKE